MKLKHFALALVVATMFTAIPAAAQTPAGGSGWGMNLPYPGSPEYQLFRELQEYCTNFPGNQRCTMGKIKIDLKTTAATLRMLLEKAGLPTWTQIDLYTVHVDDSGRRLGLPMNEGVVSKHNNWFNNGYRIEAGTYIIQFMSKGNRMMYSDYVRIRPEYFTQGEPQIYQVSGERFAQEPDVNVIQQRPAEQRPQTLQQWRTIEAANAEP